MSLLKALGLHVKAAPALRAAAGSTGLVSRGPGHPLADFPQDQLPDLLDPRGRKPLSPDELELFFPVTLNGKTRKQIEETIANARESFAWDRGDQSRRASQHAAFEKGLVAEAAKVEKVLQVPPAKRKAEIQKNAGPDTRDLGRDARNARGSLVLSSTLLKTLNDLLADARIRLVVAQNAIDAESKLEQAASLRAEAKAINDIFDLFNTLFDKAKDFDPTAAVGNATIAGIGFKMVTWGAAALAGADKLTERATALEAQAKALLSDNLRKTLLGVTTLSVALAKRLHEAGQALKDNAESFNQQSAEAQQAFDAETKGSFRFAAFVQTMNKGADSVAMLERSAGEQREAIRGKRAIETHLTELSRVAGKCAPHHPQGEKLPDFRPDPATVKRETAKLQAIAKAGAGEVSGMRKLLEGGLQEIERDLSKIQTRQERWVAYFEAAQMALFSAPEPPRKRKP